MRRNEGTITQCVYIQSKAALKCKAAIANVLIMIMYLMTLSNLTHVKELLVVMKVKRIINQISSLY